MQDDPADIAPPRINSVATLVAAGLGSGLSPVAPGTAGSAFAAFLLLPVLSVGVASHWMALAVATAIGVWAADRAGREWGVIDHPAIVIDEVVGLWLAVLIPLTLIPKVIPDVWLLLLALLLFRLFDIVKPWPVNHLERSLPRGWGVMFDDVAAGAMAGVCLTAGLIGVAAA